MSKLVFHNWCRLDSLRLVPLLDEGEKKTIDIAIAKYNEGKMTAEEVDLIQGVVFKKASDRYLIENGKFHVIEGE